MSSQPLRLLAVENEAAHALALRLLLAQQGYELAGLATTAADARRMFDELRPDLLLLDVNIAEPGAADQTDGIALAQELTRRRAVPLIFLTSFPTPETFARARQVGPFAFLSKPYDAALINYTIELAVQHFAQLRGAGAEPGATDLAAPEGVFFVREQGHLRRLAFDDIQRVEADDSYVHLYTAARKYTVRSSLRDVQDKLPGEMFLQVHRSWLVRLSAIEEIDYGAGEVRIGEQRIPLSRTGRDSLRHRLAGRSL